MKPVLGFTLMPDIQPPLWHELIEHGGTKLPGVFGYVDLYLSPDASASPVLTIADVMRLKVAGLEYEGHWRPMVFGLHEGWTQVQTDDGRFLWSAPEDTAGFLDYESVLWGRTIAINAPETQLRVDPDPSAVAQPLPEILNEQRSFTVQETRVVDGELWLRVRPFLGYGNPLDDTIPRDAPVREFDAWTRAHTPGGLPAHGLVVIC